MNKDSEILFEAVERLIKKSLRKISYEKVGRIISKTNDEKYKVALDGYEYEVKNGSTWTFNKGDKCLVHYINGNENNKIIIAKL